MRKIFRFRTLLILAAIGGVVALVMSRRSTPGPVAYPDPWLAPQTPGASTSEVVDPINTNGVVSSSAQSESAES